MSRNGVLLLVLPGKLASIERRGALRILVCHFLQLCSDLFTVRSFCLAKANSGEVNKMPMRADLAQRPDDPAWQSYCPNAHTLQALEEDQKRKG